MSLSGLPAVSSSVSSVTSSSSRYTSSSHYERRTEGVPVTEADVLFIVPINRITIANNSKVQAMSEFRSLILIQEFEYINLNFNDGIVTLFTNFTLL